VLTGLHTLELSGCRLTDETARLLVGLDGLVRNVRDMSVNGTRLSPALEQEFALAHYPHLRSLTRRWVPHLDWLTPERVAPLRSLAIHDTEPLLTPEQADSLADLLPGSAIEDLTLEWWPLTDTTAARLGAVDSAAGVRSITFAATGRPDVTAEMVRLSLTNRPHLRALYLTHCPLTPEFIRWLGENDLTRQLRILKLDSLTPDGLAALGRSVSFPHLHTLAVGLDWSGPADGWTAHLRELLNGQRLPQLTTLYLTDSRRETGQPAEAWIADATAMASVLRECVGVVGLHRLGLFVGAADYQGSRTLAESAAFDALRVLDVTVWHLSRDEVRQNLAGRFGPRVRVY
jgi:hypothetical protein